MDKGMVEKQRSKELVPVVSSQQSCLPALVRAHRVDCSVCGIDVRPGAKKRSAKSPFPFNGCTAHLQVDRKGPFILRVSSSIPVLGSLSHCRTDLWRTHALARMSEPGCRRKQRNHAPRSSRSLPTSSQLDGDWRHVGLICSFADRSF